jgi:hypothetical protein
MLVVPIDHIQSIQINGACVRGEGAIPPLVLEKCKASAFRDIGTEAERGLTTYLSQNQSRKPVVITAYCMQIGAHSSRVISEHPSV